MEDFKQLFIDWWSHAECHIPPRRVVSVTVTLTAICKELGIREEEIDIEPAAVRLSLDEVMDDFARHVYPAASFANELVRTMLLLLACGVNKGRSRKLDSFPDMSLGHCRDPSKVAVMIGMEKMAPAHLFHGFVPDKTTREGDIIEGMNYFIHIFHTKPNPHLGRASDENYCTVM